MSESTSRVRAGAGARLALALVGLVMLVGCGATTGQAATTSIGAPIATSGPGSTFDKLLPQSVEQIPLIDDRGQPTDLGAFRGKTVVLADFLTLCQEVCPMTSADMVAVGAAATRAGLGSSVEVIEVTVDPERDTPARLAAYRALFPALANWSLLTGTPADLAALWRALGVAYGRTAEPTGQPAPRDWWTGQALTFDVSHSNIVFFLDPTGHERYLIDADPDARKATVPATLSTFLNSDGKQNLADPATGSWTPAQAEQILQKLTGRPIG